MHTGHTGSGGWGESQQEQGRPLLLLTSGVQLRNSTSQTFTEHLFEESVYVKLKSSNSKLRFS